MKGSEVTIERSDGRARALLLGGGRRGAHYRAAHGAGGDERGGAPADRVVAAAAAPAWLPSGPEASCLPDPFEGLDAAARENAEIAATALDATTVWTLDAADAAKFKDHARAATFGHITAGGAHALLAAARRLSQRPVAQLVDLGSGAGHVVIYAAALAPNVTATGHELASHTPHSK